VLELKWDAWMLARGFRFEELLVYVIKLPTNGVRLLFKGNCIAGMAIRDTLLAKWKVLGLS
jgi:hypothetical protein